MSRFQVGDTVAFRRTVAARCNSPALAAFRATITAIADGWLFLQEASGNARVMPAQHMCKVGRNGAVLELL